MVWSSRQENLWELSILSPDRDMKYLLRSSLDCSRKRGGLRGSAAEVVVDLVVIVDLSSTGSAAAAVQGAAAQRRQHKALAAAAQRRSAVVTRRAAAVQLGSAMRWQRQRGSCSAAAAQRR